MQTLFGRKKLEEDQKAKDLEAKHEMRFVSLIIQVIIVSRQLSIDFFSISINEGKRRHQLLIEHNLSLAKVIHSKNCYSCFTFCVTFPF